MSEAITVRIQVRIQASVETVYSALTSHSALSTWLAESADVDLDAGRFLFWGKYTPANPSRESGHMKLLEHQPNRLLKFEWMIGKQATIVTFKLLSRNETTTVLTLIHTRSNQLHHQEDTFTFEDYWFLHLENLRRYVDGKPSEARVDFSQPMNGNIQHILNSDATPEQIYDVLTNPKLIEKWIASNARIDLKKDGDYDLGWGVEGIKVLDFEKNKKLSISWSDGADDLTVATWTLDASGGKTRITFTHSGFDDDHKNDGIWAGWMNFLNWIRSVAEYGKGWQPPAIPLENNDYAFIYPRSMHEAQSDLQLAELEI